MSFGKNDITGAVSGFSNILVWDAQGRLKVIGGGTPPPPAPVVWGTITGLVTNQTDLINYLGLNFYPLSSNPAGYLTQTAADLLYYPLSSNPSGFITAAALAGYVPNTRTLTINGTSYDLSADRSWTIPAGGTVTSVGLTVPSAFSVTPGSITVSGTFVITGAGTVSQYIDGTGALQTFPTIPTVTPSALTKTDDTNVTLTLGGTPATALLQSVSLTLGWTGILATGRGGTGLSSIGTALQYLRVNSGGTALEYATFPTIPAQYNPTAGTGISITGAYPNQTISNTLPDQTVVLTGGAGISTSGTYPNFTITNTSPSLGGTVTSVQLSAGTGISLSGTNPITTSGIITVTNSAPDQTVSLANGTGISVTGTYPSFTITNTGLTSVPGLQEVLIAGSTLTQDNTINGGGFNQLFDNNHKFNINAEQLVGLLVNDGTQSVQFNLYPQAGTTIWAYDDGVGNNTAIEMTGVNMYIQTPGYASASNGDVLTLINNATGQVEYQTPTTTTGDSLSPLLLMGG